MVTCIYDTALQLACHGNDAVTVFAILRRMYRASFGDAARAVRALADAGAL